MRIRRLFCYTFLVCVLLFGNSNVSLAEEIVLDEGDTGRAIVLHQGQYLRVSLPANPSTGFTWQYSSPPDPSILMERDRKFVSKHPGLPGAGGTEVLRYEAVGRGQTSVHLEYKRLWENAGAVKAFKVDITVQASVKGSPVKVVVNDEELTFPDAGPYINADKRTMVPLRFVSEALGCAVEWEESGKSVLISREGKTISLTIGRKIVLVDGVRREMDTTPVLKDGRTMVPLRFVSEFLDKKVDWDQETHTVTVYSSE